VDMSLSYLWIHKKAPSLTLQGVSFPWRVSINIPHDCADIKTIFILPTSA